MDATGAVVQRFPLVARPRPLCTALPARVGALVALAGRAVRTGDLTAAAQVHNQAALIASDCAQPGLARSWCHGHARAWLDRSHHTTTPARHVLEPLINLARLHTRAGNADAAFSLLDGLLQAVLARTDTVIDGIDVPTAALTDTEQRHQATAEWLWGVHIADGTRALTAAGRWEQAERHLQRRNGIGRRLLDGRQVAIVARIVTEMRADALQLLNDTEPGEPWENAVTACLSMLAQPTDRTPATADVAALTSQYHALQSDPSLTVFRTRLALAFLDAVQDHVTVTVDQIRDEAVHAVLHARDGYAARDLLGHPPVHAALQDREAEELNGILHDSGLGTALPNDLAAALRQALDMAANVIRDSTIAVLR
jgi:hypothetical protein